MHRLVALCTVVGGLCRAISLLNVRKRQSYLIRECFSVRIHPSPSVFVLLRMHPSRDWKPSKRAHHTYFPFICFPISWLNTRTRKYIYMQEVYSYTRIAPLHRETSNSHQERNALLHTQSPLLRAYIHTYLYTIYIHMSLTRRIGNPISRILYLYVYTNTHDGLLLRVSTNPSDLYVKPFARNSTATSRVRMVYS